jgi:hypothetical protein
MMSSVIPARLQYQCGHAALVSLPRVKGETATQRNDRVAREKSAALLRQCDFCTPANGSHPLIAAEIAETSPVLEIVVPAVEAPVEERLVTAAEVGEALIVESEPVVAEVFVAETPVEETPVVEVVVVEAEPAPAPKVLVRKPRIARQRVPTKSEVARGRQFLVEYRVERILYADTIHDALRQLSNLGNGEPIAITRED